MKHLVFLMIGMLFSAQVWAQIPERPNPPRLVNDLADIIDAQQEQSLEQFLTAFADSTSNQITVVTVPSLNGYEPAEMATEIGHQWGVGQEKFDNGVVVLVKPKYGPSDRGEVFIAVGYGLEGAIPDAVAKRIIEYEMIPDFKTNNYTQGIIKATVILMNLARGEFSAQEYQKRTEPKKLPAILPFLMIVGAIILIFVGRLNAARHYSMGHNVSLWTALWMMSSMNSTHRGRWGHFTSGSGSFGGGGGGFGGFGGGGFGGGGAGGSW